MMVSLFASLLTILPLPVSGGTSGSWSVSQNGRILQVGYGSGADFPQYVALHLDSGYLRLSYNSTAGWGTSISLLPAFWSGGRYYQGAPISVSWHEDGADLVLSTMATVSSLTLSSEVRLSPPKDSAIKGQVTASVQGSVQLDPRPGEAFKPVLLSSMHISATAWDAQSAYVACRYFPIPESGWIIPPQPPVVGRVLGLRGGTSTWKDNAPTVEIVLNEPLPIAGWVTQSSDPNDDNVAYWAASDQLITSWSYTVRAAPSPSGCQVYLPLVIRQ